MAKILCIDGKYRQLIPAETLSGLSRFKIPSVKDNESISKYFRRQAYCYHCRKRLGYIDIKSDEARQHTCNKLYNDFNQKERLI